jgi:hypothetical protein
MNWRFKCFICKSTVRGKLDTECHIQGSTTFRKWEYCCWWTLEIFRYQHWKITELGILLLPKSSRNWNAARKPLVVQLCASTYLELYPLWIIRPNGVLLWGRVWFFLCIFVTSCWCVMFNLYYEHLYWVFCYKLNVLISFTLQQATNAHKWRSGTAVLFL